MTVVLVAIMAVLTLAYYGIFRAIILESYIELDQRLAHRDMERCIAALDREISLLNAFVHDWSSWDDTYAFVIDRNTHYIENNFVWQVFEDQRINMIQVYDHQGVMVYGKTYDLASGNEIALDLSRELGREAFRRLVMQTDPERSTQGLISTRHGVMMISANPVLTTDNKGPSRGSMIMGRLITDETVALLSEQVSMSLQTWPASAGGIPQEAKDLGKGQIRLVEVSEDILHAFSLIPDISGRPALLLKASLKREVMSQGRWAYTLGLIYIVAVGLIVLAAVSLLLGRMVITPLNRLTGNVLAVKESAGQAKVFATHRTDELGTLSREFGAMIERLSEREKTRELGEKRLRQIIDLVPHFIFAKDVEGRFVLVNRAGAEFYGTTPGDITGKTLDMVVPQAEECAHMLQEDREIISGNSPLFGKEEVMTGSGGVRRLVQTSKIPFTASGTSTPAVLGVSVDITELKEAEEALRMSQRRLSDIIDFLPDATFAVDADQRVIAWNRAMERMSGIPKEEIMGKDCHGITSPFYGEQRPVLADFVLNDHEDAGALYDFLTREDDKIICEPFAKNLRNGRGAHIWAIAAPLYDAQGKKIGAIQSIRDITERKKAEELLHRHGETIEQLLDGVMMTDLDGMVQYANPSWADMHGYERQEILGRHLSIFHTEDLMSGKVADFMASLSERGSVRGNLQHIRKDGSLFSTLATAFILKGERDEPRAIIWMARDITDELKMENQLRQAQKMEVVGRLAGGVAHDLNNMLSPILGYAEIILAELPETSPMYDDITQIRGAAVRARNLTHELLAFSRKQVLDMKVVDLGEVVSSYGKMLRRTIREDISLQINQKPTRGAVRVDVGQMGQVLMNLAVNAQDAMQHGGSITIDICDAVLDEAYALSHQGVEPGEYVVMSVSDTGLGIDRSILQHIFEPFFTTKERGRGTGLGLATVYGIVRQHGGHISVYSEPGMGTTFKIFLPSVQAAMEGLGASPRIEMGKSGKETIVLAEDDEGVRDLTCDILRKHGYHVITAGSAAELVNALRQYTGSVDMLLTDVIMPDMNGKELHERLRADYPGLRVLFMSGYTDDVIAHHGMLEEGVSFIQKPFSINGLTEKIREVLGD
jgi:PAS domain S-box-containing protein